MSRCREVQTEMFGTGSPDMRLSKWGWRRERLLITGRRKNMQGEDSTGEDTDPICCLYPIFLLTVYFHVSGPYLIFTHSRLLCLHETTRWRGNKLVNGRFIRSYYHKWRSVCDQSLYPTLHCLQTEHLVCLLWFCIGFISTYVWSDDIWFHASLSHLRFHGTDPVCDRERERNLPKKTDGSLRC